MGDLDKLIEAKDFKKCPKSNKSPNLVTLAVAAAEGEKEIVRLTFLLKFTSRLACTWVGRKCLIGEFEQAKVTMAYGLWGCKQSLCGALVEWL